MRILSLVVEVLLFQDRFHLDSNNDADGDDGGDAKNLFKFRRFC